MSDDLGVPADLRAANGLVADDDVILGYPAARPVEQPLTL
jgi:hypothetical protein